MVTACFAQTQPMSIKNQHAYKNPRKCLETLIGTDAPNDPLHEISANFFVFQLTNFCQTLLGEISADKF